MLSQAYQMSTAWNEQAARIDPENRLLWRMPRGGWKPRSCATRSWP